MPVRTIPPLRELAPQPKVSASRTATFTPRLASARAADKPQNPAPTPATSTESGSSEKAATAGESTVVVQKFLSWMSMVELMWCDSSTTGTRREFHGAARKKKRDGE